MKLVRQPLVYAVSLVAVLALSACGKKEEAAPAPAAPTPPAATQPAPAPATPAAAPISVATVELGTGVDMNQKVTGPSSTFGPKDTIYASVATTGSGKLSAKWTFQSGQTVHEESSDFTAPANTSFRINKPDGWPAGNYKVEISLNGTVAASKDFSVK
jgi:hypothetical protein